jgi:hypothetical protein
MAEKLDVNDTIALQVADGDEVEFTVVALLEDDDDGTSFAVLLHEPETDDEEEVFIVTDPHGNVLENDALAQEVLDDYLSYTDDEDDEDGGDGEA